MKITRQLATDGTFCPSAINVLQQIPSNANYYVQQRIRHPESTYRLSLQKVASAFCAVAGSYLAKTREYNGTIGPEIPEMNQLLLDQEKFLHVLQEHLDELWLVLKALIDPSSATKDPLFADRYVLDNKLPGAKSFQEAISAYKSSQRITNKLKHQQGYLRGVAVWTTAGPHFGYFLEEPDANGALGPSPDIHPDQCAISFARDLLWHLFNVYMCSDKLSIAIQRALDARGISVKPALCSGEQVWEKVVALAQELPFSYFPRDRDRKVVSFHCDDRSKTLTMEFPRRTQFVLPRIIKVSIAITIDGHSPSYKTALI
jgi:hypothetical protein